MFSVRDRVRCNRFSETPGRSGLVVETWTDGPNEDFPQADVMWDDGEFSIISFEELEPE